VLMSSAKSAGPGRLEITRQKATASSSRDAAGISDSVLSKQSRVLEDAGYVEVRKGAVGRRPRTWFRLTPNGRTAFQAHVAWLQQAARVSPQEAADDEAAPAPIAVPTWRSELPQ
jgi:DNA-binding MarR family transcriptional regulator